jgi:hypothetical protein
MKAGAKMLGALGLLTLIPGHKIAAQSSRHREITMYIAAPAGTHIGGGNASTYLTNIRAKSIQGENQGLRQAIDTLDALGMVRVRGFGLLPAAVWWQSQVPINRLVKEQTDTGLSYAELLMAHTLAEKSKLDFDEIVVMRAHSRTWGQLAARLGVSEDLIVLRANRASDRIRAVRTRSRQRGDRDPSLQTTNPNLHHYVALH